MAQAELTGQDDIFEIELDEANEQENGVRDHANTFSVIGKSHEFNDRIREIVVPITDANSDRRMLRYACELARLFSARIALIYSVAPPELTECVQEYARIENYRDFYPDHVQALGDIALAKIGHRLQKKGIEFRKIITCSNAKEIVNQLVNATGTETAAIVLRTGTRNYGFAKLGFMKTLTAEMIMKSKVPVFVIP